MYSIREKLLSLFITRRKALFGKTEALNDREQQYDRYYKLLSASIGFNRLALLAGINPKMIPTAAEKPIASK